MVREGRFLSTFLGSTDTKRKCFSDQCCSKTRDLRPFLESRSRKSQFIQKSCVVVNRVRGSQEKSHRVYVF